MDGGRGGAAVKSVHRNDRRGERREERVNDANRVMEGKSSDEGNCYALDRDEERGERRNQRKTKADNFLHCVRRHKFCLH